MQPKTIHLVGAQETNAPWGVECRIIRALHNIGHDVISTDFRKNRHRLASLFEQPADLMIVCRGEEIPPEIIERVSCPTALWYAELLGTRNQTDNDANMRRQQLAQNCYAFDYVFLHDETGIDVCKDLGGQNVQWVTTSAVDQTINRKIDVEKKYDITFVGSQTAHRKQFIDAIKPHFNIHTPSIWDIDALNLLYNQSRIVLNIHLSGLKNTEVRLCEVLGAGSFLLTESLSMEDFLLEGQHIGVFLHNSVDDCLKKIDYYLKNEDKREAIAAAGHHYVNTYHTYETRLHQLISSIDFSKVKEFWPSYSLGIPFNSTGKPTLRLDSFYKSISESLIDQ